MYKFDFDCFEFDPWQVEILEVECIMADFFEAGITNMVREGGTCLILPYFIIHVKLYLLQLIGEPNMRSEDNINFSKRKLMWSP